MRPRVPASNVAPADERDEMWGVDRAPAVLCGFDELERHSQRGAGVGLLLAFGMM